jgi:hypothetical protein
MAARFATSKVWQTPLRSAVYAGIGMLFSAMTVIMMTTFPWDDSTVEEKRTMLFFWLPSFLVCHGPFAAMFFIPAVKTWANPHTLIFDGKGGLILRSVVRAQCVAVETISTIELDEQKRDNRTLWAQGIVTKFSGGTLSLPPFKERENFLKALKAVHPAVAITTV